jgi:hypothetical protein
VLEVIPHIIKNQLTLSVETGKQQSSRRAAAAAAVDDDDDDGDDEKETVKARQKKNFTVQRCIHTSLCSIVIPCERK